jgi:hypothetical protein
MKSVLKQEDHPLSPVFIDFLARHMDRQKYGQESWANQLSEELTNPGRVMRQRAQVRLERLMLDTEAQGIVDEVYRCFKALALGACETLDALHGKYRFVVIVGIPRSGGSYLTAEIFSSLGLDPVRVPAAIAHDGYPDIQPLWSAEQQNNGLTSLLQLAEYLTMLPLFFGDKRGEIMVVPKKFTKGVYAGNLFNTAFGPSAEFVLTLRHPLMSCISTYEKSGGYPKSGEFAQRSNIETWIKRDLRWLSGKEAADRPQGYLEAYLSYWTYFHINLAMSGLLTDRRVRVVKFSESSMEAVANLWHQQFSSGRTASKFIAPGAPFQFPEGWEEACESAMSTVRAVWKSVGMIFPTLVTSEH